MHSVPWGLMIINDETAAKEEERKEKGSRQEPYSLIIGALMSYRKWK